MRVAVCQMRSGADVDANLQEADRLLQEAGDGGADLAVLPELFPYLGPRAGVADVAEPVPGGPATEMLAKAATATTLEIPTREPDGSIGSTTMLVGPASQLIADAEHSEYEELVDEVLVERLRRLTDALRRPPGPGPTLSQGPAPTCSTTCRSTPGRPSPHPRRTPPVTARMTSCDTA